MTGSAGPRRFVLLDAPDGVLAALRALPGRTHVDGFNGARGSVCVGTVRGRPDAGAAVLAALRGADLILVLDAEQAVVDRLAEDLGKLGELVRGVPGTVPVLAPEQRELLQLLAAGHALGVAARLMHVSRSTADRRLAAARRALGCRTTAEAIERATAAGLIDPASPSL